VAGDLSPDGKGRLEICRGIEVGHVFQLGSKYSKAMSATFLDESGKAQVMEMGCYGIGVSRIIAAAIEQGNDERGIIWPLPMAPFQVTIAPIGYRKNAEVKNVADRLHDELQSAGFEVLLDDRDERPGVMFADLELIGIPHRITVGERGLKDGKVEYQARTDASARAIELQSASNLLKSLV
ncbi:MAG: His/Gly/Thr/Pro-type tRNA ligase C-terminal domain-containing protein, partial [Burkholderiales bacterium]